MRSTSRMNGGFTLIELMIVVAIIAIIAAIAIPGLLRARISSNETSAIGTLKSLSTAQEQFKSQAVVDQDADGTGEYAFWQELAGTSPFRTSAGLSAAPTAPSFMAAHFGTTATTGGGVSNKSGYNFVIYLPVAAAAGPAIPNPAAVPAGVPANANQQETRWACYGWPTSRQTSGNRCFVVNQEGQVYHAPNNLAASYSGVVMPAPAAAFNANPSAPNVQGTIGGVGVDTQSWQIVGG